MTSESMSQAFAIGKISFHEEDVSNRLPVARLQVIVDDRLIALALKLFHYVTANIAGSTRDQYR